MLFTYCNIGKMIAEGSKQMTFDFGNGSDERNLIKIR